jgi:pimeloyl-ACP methyl ester carboxylesterase
MQQTVSSRSGLSYRLSGAGPALLLLHGLPGSGAVWLPIAKRLGHEHFLIVPDLLGFGASAKPEGLDELHALGQAHALASLLDELGVEHVAVVGHDFGGPVALHLAGLRASSVTHLGLFATNAFPDTPVPFPLSTVTWPVLGGLSRRLLFSRFSLRMMLRTGAGRPRPVLNGATYLGDAGQLRSIRTIFEGSLSALGELYRPVEAQLARVDVPVLVGWGDRDPFFPVAHGERTAAVLGTTLRIYPRAGHFLPEERPEDVAADITRLLALTSGRRHKTPLGGPSPMHADC